MQLVGNMAGKPLFTGSLSLKSKLLLLVAVVCLAFAIILALAIFSLYKVKDLSTGVVQTQMSDLVDNSKNTREISLLFSKIHQLNLQLNESTPKIDEIESSFLTSIDQIASKTDKQEFKLELYLLQSQLFQALSNYREIDQQISHNAQLERGLFGSLDQFEIDVGEWEFRFISEGKDTILAEQLYSLIYGFREQLYEISHVNATQKAFLMSPNFHTIEDTSIPSIEELLRRVNEFPLHLPIEFEYKKSLENQLILFLSGSHKLYDLLQSFSLLMANISLQESKLLEMINKDDEKTNAQAGNLISILENIIFQSALTILLLAMSVITTMLITVLVIVRRSINQPIAQIVDGVSKLSQGQLMSRIDLDTNDELSTIGDALNNMATELHQSYTELKDSEDKFYQVFENEINALLIFDQDSGKCLDANRIALELYDVGIDEIKKLSLTDIEPSKMELSPSSNIDEWVQTVHKKLDGVVFPVEVHTGSFIRQGRRYTFKSVRDMTEHLRLQNQQQRTTALLEATLQSTNEGIIAVTNEGDITNYNIQFTDIFDLDPNVPRTGNIKNILPGIIRLLKDKNDFFNMIRSATEQPDKNIASDVLELIDGRMLECHSHLQMLNRKVVGRVWSFRDVSEYFNIMQELRDKESRLAHIAHHDSLTGLPNRLLFLDRLDQAIRLAKRSQEKLAVFFIDLDRFKSINDSLGHQVGDLLLKSFSERLKSVVRQHDTIARLGGDEFTVILESVDDPADAAKVADKILETLKQPFHADEYQFYVTSSIGISFFPDDADTADELLKNADAAMYKSKDEGRNTYHFYKEEMTEKAFERVVLEASLREALEQDQLVVYYQPQIDLLTGKLVGAEALVRWQHPERGLLQPGAFLPTAEETGLIDEIDSWVFHRVCNQVAEWEAAGLKLEGMRFAVNLSGRQLRHMNLPETYKKITEEAGCSTKYLELEISEGFVMHQPEASMKVMERLKTLGFELSIDDFGTGYSSLSYLKRLPLSKLKIDRSFVEDIVIDPNDEAISRSVIALGHSMNLKIVAEGIENEEQRSFLQNEGCDMGQGYLFSKPVLPQELVVAITSSDEAMKRAI